MRLDTKISALYGASAVLGGVLAHVVLFKFYFNYPLVVLIMQTALLLLAIECARMARLLKVGAYTFARGRELLPLSLCQVLTQLGLMSSLDGLERPLFGAIQAAAPLLAFAVQLWSSGGGGGLSNRRAALATLALVGGAALSGSIATFIGFELEVWSLLYSGLVLALSVLTALLSERYLAGTSTADLIYVNAFNMLCMLLIADVIQDELRDSMLFALTNLTMLCALNVVLLAVAGAAAQALFFYAVEHAGATNALMARNCANAIKVAVMGALASRLFYDVAPSAANWAAICACCALTAWHFARQSAAGGDADKHAKGFALLPQDEH